jgi:RNA polymerase sigma factor for flagellar operon FliA
MRRQSRRYSPNSIAARPASLVRRLGMLARAQEPGDGARNSRLLELLPQVRYVARRIHSRLPSHVPFEDLLQAGVLGLLDALRKFDPRRKVQIESYMKFRIRGAILDELRSLDWSPRELRRKARRLEQVDQQLRARLGRDPAAPEMAKAMGVSLAQFHRLRGELRGLELGSLQDVAMTTEDGLERDYSSRLPAPEASSPLALCSGQERRARLEEAMRRLTEKERLVLTLYYYEELTMKEVGEVLSVGESRVSQIHSTALLHLRENLRPPAKATQATPASQPPSAPVAGAFHRPPSPPAA